MPNTLAHIAVQGAIGRSLLRPGDLIWILIGCVIPDVAWIIWRVGMAVAGNWVPYQLKLYAIVQSSLLGSMILCAAIAALTPKPGRVFALLSVNAFLHLLLDATQTKWANGAIFGAPLTWRMTNFGLYWPEEWPTTLMTVLGLAACIYFSWRYRNSPLFTFTKPTSKKMVVAGVFLLLYVGLPPMIWSGAVAADNHFVHTLARVGDRLGRPVELDRSPYRLQDDQLLIRTITGEYLVADAPDLPQRGRLSVRATFIDSERILIDDYHWHNPGWRDGASVVGLAWLLGWVLWKSGRRPSGALGS